MKYFLLFIISSILISCSSDIIYEENKAIPEGVWSVDNKLDFVVDIQSTDEAYNLFLNLRNGTEYAYSNLYIFMETVYPNGRSELDTLQFLLADKEGKWYGEGLGDIKSSSVMFRYKLLFPMTGEYQVKMEQAMRKEVLPGIWDVGLRVEKSTE